MNAKWGSIAGTLLLALAVTATPAVAQSNGVGTKLRGIELLPQFLNPSGAVFVYDLLNQSNRRVGGGYAVVDHDAVLPSQPDTCVPVEGGEVFFLLGWQFTHGRIVGGCICMTGDPNVFDVDLYVWTNRGECLYFCGTLDHRPLHRRPPGLPTVEGYLYPCYLPSVR